MGHNNALTIIAFFFALSANRLQMLPNRLSGVKIGIAAINNETHVDHNLCHGYLSDRGVLIDLKLSQYLIKVLFEALHQKLC